MKKKTLLTFLSPRSRRTDLACSRFSTYLKNLNRSKDTIPSCQQRLWKLARALAIRNLLCAKMPELSIMLDQNLLTGEWQNHVYRADVRITFSTRHTVCITSTIYTIQYQEGYWSKVRFLKLNLGMTVKMLRFVYEFFRLSIKILIYVYQSTSYRYILSGSISKRYGSATLFSKCDFSKTYFKFDLQSREPEWRSSPYWSLLVITHLYMEVLLHVWVYSSPIWGGKSSSQSMTSSSSKITAATPPPRGGQSLAISSTADLF